MMQVMPDDVMMHHAALAHANCDGVICVMGGAMLTSAERVPDLLQGPLSLDPTIHLHPSPIPFVRVQGLLSTNHFQHPFRRARCRRWIGSAIVYPPALLRSRRHREPQLEQNLLSSKR